MNLPISLDGKKVLVAGCGGGYDVVCGLPVALELASWGCEVHLASFSFTALADLQQTGTRGRHLVVVGPQSQGEGYCPEVHLSRWLAERPCGISPDIFCYTSVGVGELREAFDQLKSELNLDALVLVDGGVDGLFRGDEHELGSPTIDAVSMVAGTLCSIPKTYYVMTAFGTEGVNHEVSHAEALERIADVSRQGGLLGVSALVSGDPITQQFDRCIDTMYAHTERRHQSNMVGSLRAAYRGEFGDVAVTSKTVMNPVWVSPLTSLYWFLDLSITTRLKLYFEGLAGCTTYQECCEVTRSLSLSGPARMRHHRPAIPI